MSAMQGKFQTTLLLAFAMTHPAFAQAPLATPGLSMRQALQSALAQNINIVAAQSQASAALGAAQQAEGTFDTQLGAQQNNSRSLRPLRADESALVRQSGFNFESQSTTSISIQASLARQFQNGLQASASLSQNHVRDNSLAAQGIPQQSTSALNFQLRIPLLRNAGGAASAPLRAARIEAEAARAELEFTAAQTVLTAALAFWDYLARTERLAISQDSERRSEALLEELRKLVAADERPRAELQLTLANVSERRGTRIAAEQALLESRRNLVRVLGLPADAALALLNLSDAFPHPGQAPAPAAARLAPTLKILALQSRADLNALNKRAEAAAIRTQAARNNERPQLDVVLSAAQNGLSEGSSALNLGAAFQRTAQPGFGAGVVFQMPLENNAAMGLTQQQNAAQQSLQDRQRELGYAIENAIDTSVLAVQRSALQLGEADVTVQAYGSSLDNERTKRRLGLATLIDVLNVEDRYNAALLSAVQARQGYASALAQLHFETAKLIAREGEQYSARVELLLSPLATTPQ